MDTKVTFYKPPGGLKFNVKVMRGKENPCEELAEALYRIANAECPQPSLEGQDFKPNYVYEFANGLFFRAFTAVEDPKDKVLEFYVPPRLLAQKQELFARIPRLLETVGVEKEALLPLKKVLQEPSQMTKNG